MTTALRILLLLLLAVPAAAEPWIGFAAPPEKSPVGPGMSVELGVLTELHIVVSQADLVLGGAAFRLVNHAPDLLILQSWTLDGIVVGSLEEGIEVGFYDPVPQFGDEAVMIFTLRFMVLEYGDHFLDIEAHPDYATPRVADAGGVQHAATGGSFNIHAEPELAPVTGIYFDPDGTIAEGTYDGGEGKRIEAWVVVRRLNFEFDWMGFSLELPAPFTLAGYEYAEGVTPLLGELPGDLALDFSAQVQALGVETFAPVRLLIAPGSQVVESAELRPGGYEAYEAPAPLFLVGRPVLSEVTGATISIPVLNERSSWGAVKSLY